MANDWFRYIYANLNLIIERCRDAKLIVSIGRLKNNRHAFREKVGAVLKRKKRKLRLQYTFLSAFYIISILVYQTSAKMFVNSFTHSKIEQKKIHAALASGHNLFFFLLLLLSYLLLLTKTNDWDHLYLTIGIYSWTNAAFFFVWLTVICEMMRLGKERP